MALIKRRLEALLRTVGGIAQDAWGALQGGWRHWMRPQRSGQLLATKSLGFGQQKWSSAFLFLDKLVLGIGFAL
jgi:hypothetical protein